ncbi:MAG: hypothetical protein R3C11_13975 [Planctomycetaceae bacterium]
MPQPDENLERLPPGRRRRKSATSGRGADGARPGKPAPGPEARRRSKAAAAGEETKRIRKRDPEKKQSQTTSETEASRDPLGKLLKLYGTNLATAVFILLIMLIPAAIAFGVMFFTEGQVARISMFVGAAFCLIGFVLFCLQLLNVNKRLELRRHGIRYVNGSIQTEFFWNEIVDIEVKRVDSTNLGVVSVHTHSNDARKPTNIMSRTDWDITIVSQSGRKIHLGDTFTNIIHKPQELIAELRLYSNTM